MIANYIKSNAKNTFSSLFTCLRSSTAKSQCQKFDIYMFFSVFFSPMYADSGLGSDILMDDDESY
jgi:hypothetical protein